ncbi:MAG: right-handed parallel beta-helix repeat-containing protein [Planctomycetes bacterium]|nr:right-handed parallel beta-helix repeat-containing protein [Planctomycetota bacterium]
MRQRLLPLLVSLAFATQATAQQTWYVPDDFATIQSAIDQVRDSDTVIVRDGVYDENLFFRGKGITLKSESGPQFTVIDGQGRGSAIAMIGSSTRNPAVLEGFTILNGSGTFDQSANIECGGGIYCSDTSVIIRNNIIQSNKSGFGGGIACRSNSTVTLENNVIEGNSANAGGGVSIVESKVLIFSNYILGNKSIAGNGGGIASATSPGLVLQGNIISNNESSNDGGGISCLETSPNLDRNTIVMNRAIGQGGGMAFYGGCYPTVMDSILWDNSAPSGSQAAVDGDSWQWGYSAMRISYSDLQGGKSGVYVAPGNSLTWAAGMIDQDPQFIGPGDWNLLATSPCIDAGNPFSQLDPDRTRADMGALYFDQATPTLSASGLIAGQRALVEITNATPNNKAHVAWSVRGGGPTPTPWGDAMLTPPYQVVLLSTDSAGYASYSSFIPASASGITVWLHGTDVGTQSMLNAFSTVIR